MRKIFMSNFPARKRKSVLSAIVSFVILVFTINCAMNLGANASFELPNNDPSKNTNSQSPEKDILRKDLTLIDFVDCFYPNRRFSPFSRLTERLLDFHTNNPITRSVYERTLNFFVKKKSEMQNPWDLKKLDEIKQSTWDEFNRLREEALNYSGNASEGSSDYEEEVFISILGDLFGEPLQHQEGVPPRPETTHSDGEPLPHQEDAPPRPETTLPDGEPLQHQEDAPPRPEITLPDEEPLQHQEDVPPRPETTLPDGNPSQHQEDAPPRPETTLSDGELPRPLLPDIDANDYTQPEPGSSDSDACFDADGYLRPLANMPDILPPNPLYFVGK